MKLRCTVPIILTACLLLLSSLYLGRRSGAAHRGPAASTGEGAEKIQDTEAVALGGVRELPGELGPAARAVFKHLAETAAAIGRAGDQATRDELVANLRADLGATTAESAVSAIVAFLEGGSDAGTGQHFEVATSGHLDSAPTVRTLLLDTLGQLSVPAAAEIARGLLEAPPVNAAEWALALRDYVRGNSLSPAGGTDRFFRTKVHTLLGHTPWHTAPTPGFLYAMDAAVFSGDAESVRLLASLAAQEIPAVRRVAFDKLARLAYDDFASLSPLLETGAEFAALRPEQRGTLYAYADVRDPAQRETVARFLDLVGPDDAAAKSFATNYPNFSLGIASELLTETPPRDELDDIDAVLAAWDASKSWSTTTPALAATTERLERLVRSIESGIADR